MKIIVVVSQSATANAQRRDHEEQLIADLLMAGDGCEVTVVPDVAELGEETTGRLCLEGIKGDMILLSWYPPHEAFQHLADQGIRGRFGRTSRMANGDPLPPGVYDAMQRRIYCIELEEGLDTHQLRREIKRIDAETQIKTVDLIGSSPAIAPPSAVEPTNVEPAIAEVSRNPAPVGGAIESASSGTIPAGEDDEEEAALDSLVDQLDELDL